MDACICFFYWKQQQQQQKLNPLLSVLCLKGQLTEGADVVDYLMEQPNVVPRMNSLILSNDRKYLDFTANPSNKLLTWNPAILIDCLLLSQCFYICSCTRLGGHNNVFISGLKRQDCCSG